MAKSFKDLIVWQKSMELAASVYALVKFLPKEETYALSDQIRRAAVSIPSNIAEGNGRASRTDYLRFLYISNGSCNELETQLIIAAELGFLDAAQRDALLQKTNEVGKMLGGLINRLSAD